jgi:hypothetical protein
MRASRLLSFSFVVIFVSSTKQYIFIALRTMTLKDYDEVLSNLVTSS